MFSAVIVSPNGTHLEDFAGIPGERGKDWVAEAMAAALQNHRAGQFGTAAQTYRQVLTVQPQHADAWHLLGLVAYQFGKHPNAAEHIGRAIALNPRVASYHSNLGLVYRALNRLDEAIGCWQRALELDPSFAEAHSSLGSALRQEGRIAEAIACYRRALALKPDFADAHNNLGNALHEQGELAEALACFQRALRWKPNDAKVHNNLGAVLKDQGRIPEATACYERAVQLEPDFPEAHNNLGTILKEQGRLADAERSLREAIRLDPRHAKAHFGLAELLRGKLPEADLAAQRKLLSDPHLTDEQRCLLHFGLGQALDARGAHAEAAADLQRANALRASEWRKCGQRHDPGAHAEFVSRTIAACTPVWFERVRGWGLETERPVFIVGLPRSGTTLVEQILAGHPKVFGAGELRLAREEFAMLGRSEMEAADALSRIDRDTVVRLGRRHLDRLCELNESALRVTDKLPDNYLHLGLLAILFPRAKFIHCRRDLRDVAVSCWLTNFREVYWASDPEHIVSRFRQYQRLMEHWRNVLPVPVLDVVYEETVADLESVARRLVAWCGLEWDSACLEFYRGKRIVRTASLVQVREPIYTKSVGRWKHYQAPLAAMLARLTCEPPQKT